MSYVYFVQAASGGPIKIGLSVDPVARVRSLQGANADELVVLRVMPGNWITEMLLHERLEHRRVRGEWFEDCDEVRAAFADTAAAA